MSLREHALDGGGKYGNSLSLCDRLRFFPFCGELGTISELLIFLIYLQSIVCKISYCQKTAIFGLFCPVSVLVMRRVSYSTQDFYSISTRSGTLNFERFQIIFALIHDFCSRRIFTSLSKSESMRWVRLNISYSFSAFSLACAAETRPLSGRI